PDVLRLDGHCSLRSRAQYDPLLTWQLATARFPRRCPIVNTLLPPGPGLGDPRRAPVNSPHGTPERVRVAYGRGARRPFRAALVHRRAGVLEVGGDHARRAPGGPRR